MTTSKSETIAVYLDDSQKPLLEGRPPAAIEIDTCALDDGEHLLRVEAWDSTGSKGVRRLPFQVRNGPAIVVNGLSADSVVHGKLSMVVHAYGEGAQGTFEPELAEVPAPIPTWAWVLLIMIFAWALFYAVSSFQAGEGESRADRTSEEFEICEAGCEGSRRKNHVTVPLEPA